MGTHAPGRLLVLTPAFSGGSWTSTRRLLTLLSSRVSPLVVGLGRKPLWPERACRIVAVPFPRYDKHGWVTVGRPVVALLWHVPLLAVGLVWGVWRRGTVVCNGLALALPLAPVLRRMGCRTVVLFHGHVDDAMNTPAVVRAARSIDLAVANSEGSRVNLLQMFPEDRVVVQPHVADVAFFTVPLERPDPSAPTTLLYVGRLDEEKVLDPLLLALEHDQGLHLNVVFAGVGEYEGRVRDLAARRPGIDYRGYVGDVADLLRLYEQADAVWAYGDETYLALPAVEALAAGRPVLIPDKVAVRAKWSTGATVAAALVPTAAGWLVDAGDSVATRRLLHALAANGTDLSARRAAREWAKTRYVPDGGLAVARLLAVTR